MVRADLRPFQPGREPQDVADFVAGIGAAAPRGFFAADRPLALARAPGRLDVMGGIADYSGSLVLQLPIAQAAMVAAQETAEPAVAIVSLPERAGDPAREFRVASEVLAELARGTWDEAREFFRADPESAWAAYVAGVLLVLAREKGMPLQSGWRLLVGSLVPEGKGVSSSAALEVAAMSAVAAAAGLRLEGAALARLCQLAENRVVGAPCGIMDQMTSAIGRGGQLLELLCQPAEIRGFRPLPPGLGVWGIDSGIRHAVSGSDYSSVRSGAFMGYRIIAERAGLEVSAPAADGRVVVSDPTWNGYLANLAPAQLAAEFAAELPEQLSGADFLRRFRGITDPVTRVEPDRTYAVRQPTEHPVHEHARVRRFAELLGPGGAAVDRAARLLLGELMYASHESYSACGLGCDGTDLLVELVRSAGPAAGLYGAKITGGGSGGTVAVLGDARAGGAVAEIAGLYARRTGREARIFSGSSPGAFEFGVVRVERGGSA